VTETGGRDTPAESPEAMRARMRASFDRQGMMACRGQAFTDGSTRPFAVMQATMSALYNRPGISG
jgi:hypothetical protein